MKPIFVCYIGLESSNEIEIIRKTIDKELMNEYHILVVADNNYTETKFELFNSELENKDFEDLKNKLIDNFKS